MAQLISEIAKAAILLQEGKLVAFPTETVYGLGADATNSAACQAIYSLKGRPSFNPLIVHVDSIQAAEEIGVFSPLAIKLAQHFWPGALTLVLPVKPQAKISPNVTAGLQTVGVRVPSHPLALEFLKAAKKPVAAPSANISNYVSATSYEHVLHDFLNSDLHILVSGDYKEINVIGGLESTIVDVSSNSISILRSGMITKENIQHVIGLSLDDDFVECRKIKSPGMLSKHYSPRASLRLNANNLQNGEVGIDFASNLQTEFSLSASGNLFEAAKNLYDTLRKVDQYATKYGLRIAVAPIPNVGIGVAINDKLNRAAS